MQTSRRVIGNDSTDAPLLDGQSAALVYSNDVDSQEINLWNLSQKCCGFTQLLLQHTLLGMSGRSLRKLPIRAIANVLPVVPFFTHTHPLSRHLCFMYLFSGCQWPYWYEFNADLLVSMRCCQYFGKINLISPTR